MKLPKPLYFASVASSFKLNNIRRTFAFLSVSSIVFSSHMSMSTAVDTSPYDPEYPGTAVERMLNARERVKSLSPADLNGDWTEVRRKILWAGGLRDLPDAIPGQGYTGHSFNDYNHCDLTTMLDDVSGNTNQGKVKGIAFSNHLGTGIKIASLPELGPGGSWSTCMIGCASEPPRDVAHIQFRSRIAFKLVWSPPDYTSFVIVDDSGNLLNTGNPTGTLPDLFEREQNYLTVKGSKYARAAENARFLIH